MVIKTCVERVIDVPIDRAWEILSDYSNVYHIHPLVESVDQITPSLDRGVGAIRQCNLYDGHKAIEKIVEWDDSNRSYKVELIDTDIPVMKEVLATLSAVDIGNGQTKLIAKMNVKAKYGFFGKILERLVMKPQFGGAIGSVFAGVEEYNRTGKDVPKGYKSNKKGATMVYAC